MLCTLGTRGDIDPFVLIATQLTRAGCSVDVLSNANWRELVTAAGARFIPIAAADPPQNGRDDLGFFQSNIVPSFSSSFRHVETAVQSGRSPVLVYKTNMLGMECAASKFGLADMLIALQPSAIPSRFRPPWPLLRLVEGPWGGIGRTVALPLVSALGSIFSPYRPFTEHFRQLVGVPPAPLFGRPITARALAMTCPEWFCLPQPDWPSNCACVGFPLRLTKDGDAECALFLEAGPPPIVFTPGSGINDVKSFAQTAVLLARSVGHRAILLSPHISGELAQQDVLVRSFVDLAWLLPSCRAIVHHGGIGTTAEAIRAAIPQLIVAGRFDQPDNAVRVAQLGLGGAVLKESPTFQELFGALTAILHSGHVAHQVAAAAALIREQDAVSSIVATILSLRTLQR